MLIQCRPATLAEDGPEEATLADMARRSRSDPLQPLQQPTWLVVRNTYRDALKWQEIGPDVDLRVFLTGVRASYIVEGWSCDDIGSACSFFFATHRGERLQVAVERYDPAGPGAPGQSDAGHYARSSKT